MLFFAGVSIHTFHGNFFVRSTDLLSLPNVNPDAGFGMQMSIEDNLTESSNVCFQAALLYTSSKGKLPSTQLIRAPIIHNLCVIQFPDQSTCWIINSLTEIFCLFLQLTSQLAFLVDNSDLICLKDLFTLTTATLTFVDDFAQPQHQRKSMSSIGEETTA